ncbi:MAG TPA: nuclear transport factor 2 family protein, partial [Planctomycetota bacterium]
MSCSRIASLVVPLLVFGCAAAPQASDQAGLLEQVMQAEQEFADTMAKRDFAAFQGFVSESAVFITGTETLDGRARVTEAWKPFFD